MTTSYIDDEEAYETHIREKLKLTGDHAELVLETGRSLRQSRDQLIAYAYAAGLTQAEIAELVRVDQSLVSKVLTSQRRAALHNETHGGTVK